MHIFSDELSRGGPTDGVGLCLSIANVCSVKHKTENGPTEKNQRRGSMSFIRLSLVHNVVSHTVKGIKHDTVNGWTKTQNSQRHHRNSTGTLT